MINLKYVKDFYQAEKFNDLTNKANESLELLLSKQGMGNDFIGWLNWPFEYDKAEFKRIKEASKKIQETSEILIVIGIGGSYLGSRAVIEALSSTFYNNENKTEIIFAGQNMSTDYLNDVVNYVKDKEFSINVISKSGTTTEPAIAFRVLKMLLENKYGLGAKDRIYVTTDAKKGALVKQVEENQYESFVINDDIGGRYSVLTAVGLLPIAVAGIDIDGLMQGAQTACNELKVKDSAVIKYVAARNTLYQGGRNVEMLVSYNPKLTQLNEWWKQLYGESEGKENKGIFVSSAIYSTDLHSLGQYVQEGERILFETVIKIKNSNSEIKLSSQEDDSDGLNYLSGKTLDEINNIALDATVMAHVSGDVPNIIIEIDKLDTQTVGYLIYFFELACAVSGYVLNVNPFDQPGVESYKKNMFALLDKPGYEDIKKELLDK